MTETFLSSVRENCHLGSLLGIPAVIFLLGSSWSIPSKMTFEFFAVDGGAPVGWLPELSDITSGRVGRTYILHLQTLAEGRVKWLLYIQSMRTKCLWHGKSSNRAWRTTCVVKDERILSIRVQMFITPSKLCIYFSTAGLTMLFALSDYDVSEYFRLAGVFFNGQFMEMWIVSLWQL